MYLSVTCSEGTRSLDATAAARLTAATWFGNYRVLQQTRACSLWPARELPRSYENPVTSDVPVLLISGDLDPITPPKWGNEVAAHLVHSKHLIAPYQGHLPVDPIFTKCMDRVILAFLARGGAQDLDTSCFNEIQRPPFQLSDSPATNAQGMKQ